MKKTVPAVMLLLSLLLALSAPAIMPFAPQRTIGFHIGAKNPTFDESEFPDIDFYYTPQIKWRELKPTGTPEALVSWLNKRGLMTNQLVVTDKNGLVDFTGFLAPGKKVVEVHDLGFLRTLEESLKRVVEEGQESFKTNTKPRRWDWVSDIEGRPFPNFKVSNASGEVFNLTELITREGKPKMMIVFYVPYNYKFKSVEEHMEEAADPMAVLGAITQMESGEHHTAYLKAIEEELYNR
jgi:hypothetical protein